MVFVLPPDSKSDYLLTATSDLHPPRSRQFGSVPDGLRAREKPQALHLSCPPFATAAVACIASARSSSFRTPTANGHFLLVFDTIT